MRVSIPQGVGAFSTPAGLFYALFEKSSEGGDAKCAAFGTIAQVVRWIFTRAGMCETGAVRGPLMALRPEEYVASWRRLLEEPHRLFTQPVFFEPGTRGASVWYHEHGLPSALDALVAHGYTRRVEMLRAGQGVTLDLHRDAVALADAFEYDPSGPDLAPNHLIYPWSTQVDTALGYTHKSTRIGKVPGVRLCCIAGSHHFVLHVHGHPTMIGPLDKVLYRFCRGVATTCELKWRNGGTDALTELRAQYRDGFTDVPAVDPSTGVTLDTKEVAEAADSFRGEATRLLAWLPWAEVAEGRYAFRIEDARREGLLDNLLHMPSNALGVVAPTTMRRLIRPRKRRALAA